MLTTAEVAELLGISPRSVRLLVRRGGLASSPAGDPAMRLGGGGPIHLFRRADVDAYAAAREARRERLRTTTAMTATERSRRRRERARAE